MRKQSTRATGARAFRPALSPDEYGRIFNGLELRDIVLDEARASVDRKALSQADQEVPVLVRERSDYSQNADLIVRCEMKAACALDNKTCFLVEATYSLIFASEATVSNDFFEIFQVLSLPLYVWPFFRELVNSMTARMGIRPLTLPLRKPMFEDSSAEQ